MNSPSNLPPLEFQFLPKPPLKTAPKQKQQVVQWDPLLLHPKMDFRPEKKAPFLSRFQQRVRQEQKAQLNPNPFQEKPGSSSQGIASSSLGLGSLGSFKGRATKENRKNPLIINPYPREGSIGTERNGARGTHTGRGRQVIDLLPNSLMQGSFAALNTDRYSFYSFFERIRQLIAHRWIANVRATLSRQPRSFWKRHKRGQGWHTEIKVQLDRKGHYLSSQLIRSSGSKGLDQAAIQAFMEAAHFPNPPKELVDEEGLIQLRYGFFIH